MNVLQPSTPEEIEGQRAMRVRMARLDALSWEHWLGETKAKVAALRVEAALARQEIDAADYDKAYAKAYARACAEVHVQVLIDLILACERRSWPREQLEAMSVGALERLYDRLRRGEPGEPP